MGDADARLRAGPCRGALIAVTIADAAFGSGRDLWLLVVSLPFMAAATVYYSVQTTRLPANHKSAGALRLKASPQAGTIARIYAFGYLANCLTVLLPLVPIITIVGAVESERARGFFDPRVQAGDIYGLPLWGWTVLGALAYFGVFLLWNVLRHIFVTMPLLNRSGQHWTRPVSWVLNFARRLRALPRCARSKTGSPLMSISLHR